MTAVAGATLGEEDAVVAAVRAGDEAAFVALAERYRRQLQVHCYRMLGSVEDAEDVVQETLLRAWRARAGFEGRSLFRTWLYRIATNLCLNELGRRPRRILPPIWAQPPILRNPSSSNRCERPRTERIGARYGAGNGRALVGTTSSLRR